MAENITRASLLQNARNRIQDFQSQSSMIAQLMSILRIQSSMIADAAVTATRTPELVNDCIEQKINPL